MIDNENPFGAFEFQKPEGDPPAADKPKPAKGKKKKATKDKPKAAKPEKVAAPAPATPKPEKKVRKPRQARRVMIPLDLVADFAGMGEGEMQMLMALSESVRGMSKKSRGRVVAALAKIVG